MKNYLNCSQAELDDHLIEACKAGDLAVVRDLLTSSDLKIHADIHAENDLALRWACCHGHLHVVKYLLTSPELKEHANDEFALRISCSNGQLDVVKYLVSNPELSEHAHIHSKNYAPLIMALEKEQKEVVHFLLYDMNMQVTPQTYEHIQRKEIKEELKSWVARRDLVCKLNAHMPEQTARHRPKI